MSERPAWEPAEWNPPQHWSQGRKPSPTALRLLGMPVGETLRVHHDGVCDKGGCSLLNGLYRYAKRTGKHWQTYHEAPHIAIIRRDK